MYPFHILAFLLPIIPGYPTWTNSLDLMRRGSVSEVDSDVLKSRACHVFWSCETPGPRGGNDPMLCMITATY